LHLVGRHLQLYYDARIHARQVQGLRYEDMLIWTCSEFEYNMRNELIWMGVWTNGAVE